jgi:hypothetical protein
MMIAVGRNLNAMPGTKRLPTDLPSVCSLDLV